MSSRPSMSKRNGLAARFSIARTPVAVPPDPTMRPQHSLGASAMARSTTSSSMERAICTREAYLRLDALRLFLVVGGDTGDRVLELAHALAERLADLGELLGTEH